MRHRAPLITAIALLLLPLLYVGSYFALVKPNNRMIWVSPSSGVLQSTFNDYRWGGKYAEIIFWPLEQIDRKIRPRAWQVRLSSNDNGEGLLDKPNLKHTASLAP